MNRVSTEIRLGAAENAFAQIVWDRAPLPSVELVKICKDQLGWARSTTYTVLRRLCDKGLFRLEDGVVFPVLTREAFKAQQSEAFMTDTFEGSLPAFIAAFTKGKKLSRRDVADIRRMIESCMKEDDEETDGGIS